MMVGMELWICFHVAELCSPGKVARKPLSMALQSVLVGGYPRDVWTKRVNALVLGWVYALLHICWVVVGVAHFSIGTSSESICCSVASENWFVFELYVDVLVP